METAYRRKLLMLHGSQGQTGFINVEQQGPRLTIQLQAVGLDRAASDIHGYLVSLKYRRRLDCGRIRVDSRGQGGLVREWRSRDNMDGESFDTFDAIAITGGGEILLAARLSAAPINPEDEDWYAIRAVCRLDQYARKPQRAERINHLGRFERIDGADMYASSPPSNGAADPYRAAAPQRHTSAAESIIERMQPYQSIDTPPDNKTTEPPAKPIPQPEPATITERIIPEPAKPSESAAAITNDADDVPSKPIAELISLLTTVPEESIRAITEALKDQRCPRSLPIIPSVPTTPAIQTFEAHQGSAISAIQPQPSGISPMPPPAAEPHPSAPELTFHTADAVDETRYHHPAAETEPAADETIRPTVSQESLSARRAARREAAMIDTADAWPVWSAYRKPMWMWPDEADDLREVFERGAPSEDVSMPGWMFVRGPCAVNGEESLLGVMVERDQVTKTAVLYRGDDGAEPPAGLAGYTYDRSLGLGYWVKWRDYTRGGESA